MATQPAQQLATQQPPRALSIVDTVANRYGMQASRFVQALRATVVPNECDDAQLAAFLVVCNEYGLNPLTKEIFAFPSKGKVTPMVSIDGWVSLINRHPMMDGMEFQDIPDATGKLMAIECTIYRKDRSRPIKVIEYLAECKGTTGPWQKSPARMLRHRSLIQAGRYAFGFAGVSIEGHDVIEGGQLEPEMRDATPPRRLQVVEDAKAEVAETQAETPQTADAAVDALFYGDDDQHDPDTGEVTDADPRAAITARIVAQLQAADSEDALLAITKASAADFKALPDEMRTEVTAAKAARRAELSGGVE